MDCPPEQVSKILGIDPTSIYIRGSRSSQPPLPKRNGWHFKTYPESSDSDPDEHFIMFRFHFDGKVENFKNLPDFADISLTILIDEEKIPFTIDEWTLKFCIDIGIPINVTFDL